MKVCLVLFILSLAWSLLEAKQNPIQPKLGDCQNKEGNGKDYVGYASKTKSGLECQKWTHSSPHKHDWSSLGHNNFCRNPDGKPGVWCYTTSPQKEWELCDVPVCGDCSKHVGSTCKSIVSCPVLWNTNYAILACGENMFCCPVLNTTSTQKSTSKISTSAALCKGTDGDTYTAGEAYKVGCFQYVCGNYGDLSVNIDDTCCLHQGNFYKVGDVVAEIPYGKDCVLEHTVCKDRRQVVTEPVFGKCNCEHNGQVVKEGENVTLSTGSKASCCSGHMVTPVNKTSTNPEVKLVGGINPGMGNVYINDIPVGDCNWNRESAAILCQDLGFGDAIETPQMNKMSSSKDSHLGIFSIKCNGNEESFNDCKITDDCNSKGAASVRCSRVKIKDDGQVLLDGEALCVDGLNEMETTALCRELGFSTGMVKESGTELTFSKKISCSGVLLSDCITSECSKNSTMAVLTCSNKMDLQLLGGNGENEGNVYFRGGPVCDDDFDINDANVICRELGFEAAEQALIKSPFGLVDLPFTLDNLNCKGDETKLSECEAVKESNCGDREGSGVICARKTHSKRKRSAAAVLTALPGVMDSGSKIVGGIMNYYSEKQKQHQEYLKERPEKVDLSNDKLSIKMKPQKGYLDPSGEFSSGGFEMNIGTDAPPQKEKKDGGPAFTYGNGIGPMLMNGCFGSNYAVGDPCYGSKQMSTLCLNMIEAANYVGVGFDGTGEYTHASRKKSLIQRTCETKSTYHTEDVPDSMNIFGIYDTACTGKTFSSLDARSEFQRDQSDMGSNEDLLRYKGGSHKKVEGSVGVGKASVGTSSSSHGNKKTTSKSSRRSKGTAESKAETTRTSIFEFTCTIRRYNIFLDEVTPSMLSSAFLEDYMSLPIRYYDFRQQAPLRYSRFLQRWGTHYIKSASFGGKFTLLRKSRLHASETETEWQERIQKDTSQMFESKQSSTEANAEYSLWKRSAEATVDTEKTQTADSSAQSSNKESESNSKKKEATSYSMDDIIVEGGDQKVASILADKHRAGFKAEFTDWLDSIPVYPKGYDFMFGELAELLNMNYRSLLKIEFEPCWKFSNRYDLIDDRGDIVCEKCLYNTTVKNEKDDEVIEVRKCQFKDLDDFQDQMDRKLLSLKRATDIFIKTGGKSTTEITMPGGKSQCENHNTVYNQISYEELIRGETYRIAFDLYEDIGDEIQKSETKYISFKQGDDVDGEKWGRWTMDDSDSNTFAGHYSKKIKVDEASKRVLIGGVQFTYESDKSGSYLEMSETDCERNKKRIKSMAHIVCDENEDLYWINVPLATVHPMEIPNTFYPCHLEWSNANMLMSESSCVRFTATTEGPIYFGLAAIPDRPDSMYYLRISPTDVTIYKNSVLMDSKTKKISAVGLGHKDIFQSYIVCSEHKQEKASDERYTRITYGKLNADETINRDATLNAYLIMKDDDSPIEPTFFAFGSGEDKVQIVDLEMLDLPNIECRGDTILSNGHCVQSCKISKISKMSKETVSIKCYKDGSNETYDDSKSVVGEGSFCEAVCPDGEVAYPGRTECKGDATWSDSLNCHKQCDKNDTAFSKGLLVIDGKEEDKTLEDSKIHCSNIDSFGGFVVKGVKCQVSCGTDDFGLKYRPTEFGHIECSDNSNWVRNSTNVQNVCRSSPCSPIENVPNGDFKCNATTTYKIEGNEYVAEGTKCWIQSCNDRYIQEETSPLLCSNGEWIHGGHVEKLQCIPIDKTCSAELPLIKSGTVSCKDKVKDKTNDGNYFGGTTCSVSCAAGYELEEASSSNIQCVNGVWEVKATCGDKTCPADLGKVDHGTVSCNANDKDDSRSSYYSGTTCSVSCLNGAKLEDASKASIQCVSGDWEVKAKCVEYVLWLGYRGPTLNIPTLSLVTTDCKIPDPAKFHEYFQLQTINGRLYSCNHKECRIYNEENKTWKNLYGIKFNQHRQNAAGITIADTWLVRGGQENKIRKQIDTTVVWSPGQGNWQLSTDYMSPIAIQDHCLVNIQGSVLQIGGFNHEDRITNRCFINTKEVQGLKKDRHRHGCALHLGKVFVAGGSVIRGQSGDVEVYNVLTNQWSYGPRLPITRADHKPQLVEIDNQLHYIGGTSSGKIWRLNDVKNSWEYITQVVKKEKSFATVMKKSCKKITGLGLFQG